MWLSTNQSLGSATAVLEDDDPDDHGPEDEEHQPEDDDDPLHEAKGRNGFPNFVKIHVHPTHHEDEQQTTEKRTPEQFSVYLGSDRSNSSESTCVTVTL